VLAAELAKLTLASSPSLSVLIYTADHLVLPYCQITDRHDNAAACRTVCSFITDSLVSHPDTSITLQWMPGTASFQPLKRIQEIAIEAAARVPQGEAVLTSPTIPALRDISRRKAFLDWEEEWRANPRRSPVHRALIHPPSGETPDFMAGIAKSSRLVFCTAVRLLTEHAFTGEYNLRHRTHTQDPHDCQCGYNLQTASHVITECPLFQAARERHLLPIIPDLSPYIIFGSRMGGEALVKFIEMSQACLRPRNRDPPPEDHG
jgi:hypothetical protein